MFDPTTALATLKTGVPAFKQALQALLAERHKIARDVLLKRIRKGEPWAVAEDQMAGMLLTFFRAAEEGAARENLDLLAQVIARAEQEPTFAPVEFKRWHRVLSEMNRDEILVLGRYLFGIQQAKGTTDEANQLGLAGEQQSVKDLVGKDKPFRDAREVRSCLTALQRTGIVMNNGGLDGGTITPMPGLFDLARLVKFGDALI